MYPENSTIVEKLLYDMQTQPIDAVEQKEGGTQVKLTLTLRNGIVALFKPMRFVSLIFRSFD